jgi:hypothetical protein
MFTRADDGSPQPGLPGQGSVRVGVVGAGQGGSIGASGASGTTGVSVTPPSVTFTTSAPAVSAGGPASISVLGFRGSSRPRVGQAASAPTVSARGSERSARIERDAMTPQRSNVRRPRSRRL